MNYPIIRFELAEEIERELAKARAKFPESICSMTALTEEVGELAKALLDESAERVRQEAVQVAVMAIRVATEGDASIDAYRVRRGLPALALARARAGEG